MINQQYEFDKPTKIYLLFGNLNIRISLLSTVDPESVPKATQFALRNGNLARESLA